MNILSAFFAALLRAVFEGVNAFVDARARDAAMREAGRAEQAAADEANARAAATELGEIADDQAKNNAVDRGGAGGVLERLRRAER